MRGKSKGPSLKPYNNVKNNIVPNILNNKCANAVLRAVTVVPALAIKAVAQVPILSPKRTGTAEVMGIKPCDARDISKPTVAELLCNIDVIIRPTSIPRNGFLLNVSRKFLKAMLSLKGPSDNFIIFIPRNNNPRPNSAIPIFLYLRLLLIKNKRKPTIIKG